MEHGARQRPGILEVARLAGVSLSTVSNVLNRPERVKAPTILAVTKAIEELGFIRNDAARQLKTGNSNLLGLIVPDGADPFFLQVARGAVEAAKELGYSILLGDSQNLIEQEDHYINLFERQRVMGFLMSPIDGELQKLLSITSRGTKAVLIAQEQNPKFGCSVSVNHEVGGKIGVAHLIAHGARNITFLSGPSDSSRVRDCLTGAEQAILESGHPVTFRHLALDGNGVIDGRQAGQALVDANAADWPDAIFASNDSLAVGLLQSFLFGGQIRVPQDIRVLGYDDIDFANETVVALSSVRQPAHLIGAAAARMLIDDIEATEGRKHVHHFHSFEPELVARETTAPFVLAAR